jgi:hypothetical protein
MKYASALMLALILAASGCGGEKKQFIDKDSAGPVLIAAVFSQSGNSNYLTLQFNKAVEFAGLGAADFDLPVAGDSLGTAPAFDQGVQAFEIVITLDADYHLTAAGDYDPSNVLADDPSGIDVTAGGLSKITDVNGNPCTAVPTPQGAVDVTQ